MELLTAENAIIAVCVVLAIAGFYAMELYTELASEARIAVVLAVGVVLPMVLTNYYSS